MFTRKQIDDEIDRIDRMRTQARKQFDLDMAKFDDDSRELLGLRRLTRDDNGNILGFADELASP